MSVRERTLYNYICRVFTKYGWRCYEQVGVEGKEPDLIIEREGIRIVSEVKIDTEVKLNEAIVDAFGKSCLLKLPHSIALLFPRYVREMPLSELERAYPNLEVTAILLTQWLSDRKTLTLDNLVELLTSSYQNWLKTKIVTVNYDLVVESVRDNIRDLASYLRLHLDKRPIRDAALAVIGRFDMYRSLLEDFSGILEKEATLYIADIAAYILANQLLFYHILSEKLDYEKLPSINPITPPEDLLKTLDELFETVRKTYPHIFSLNLFPLLIETRDKRVLGVVARLIANFKAIHPEHIREDLFGRLYHETIPPETRKNLGAFYTKPEAAKLLATLAIDKFDSKVLDPACGSGTLLVESYHRKLKLAPRLPREELHKQFIDDIYGIDIMHFATHMTATNLTAQNISMSVKPNVYSRDGVASMIQCLDTDDDPPSITPITRWIEIMAGTGIPCGFDVVIMNPPFTRRERIPNDIRSSLKKLVPEVIGKTGYWAFFFIAADRVLKQKGTLASVTPEEFFVGRSAEVVRRHLLEKDYTVRYIVRSSAEVAFSEGAHYRDYLVVFGKNVKGKPLVVTILKKRLQDIRDVVEDIGVKIKDFSNTLSDELTTDEVDAFKVYNIDELMRKHVENLKPLVGFNTITAYKLVLELLDKLKDSPTLKELEEMGQVKIRDYNPGQYKVRGVEDIARKLFISKYHPTGSKVVYLLDGADDNAFSIMIRGTGLIIAIPTDATVPSLRTPSGVRHLNITGEEEAVIITPEILDRKMFNLAGLTPQRNVREAAKDIKYAYEDLAGNMLLTRRARLTSPNIYWLVFHSNNRVIGPSAPLINVRVDDAKVAEVLALYLNSTIAFLQLLAFSAETEGAWVALHSKQVWSHIHIPNIKNLQKDALGKIKKLYETIGKSDVKPLFQRIKEHDEVQRAIDTLALEVVGLEGWVNRLDELYDAVTGELEAMVRLMETSTKAKRKGRRLEAEEGEEKEEEIESLKKWTGT